MPDLPAMPAVPPMRWVLSQVPVLPFAKSSFADVVPAGILPDELFGFVGSEEPEPEPPPSTRAQQRRRRTVARGGYRPL